LRDDICDGWPILIGQAHVGTDDQKLALQCTALKEAGRRGNYEEKISGATCTLQQVARLLDQIRDQGVAFVTCLVRLARSTRDLLEITERLRDADAGLRSLGEP
jgi:DNA invertase Pin-like site-specific DNA recombinase